MGKVQIGFGHGYRSDVYQESAGSLLLVSSRASQYHEEAH